MNNQTCCFTGHRKLPEEIREKLQKRLEEEIENLIHQGVTEFRAGGALGFTYLKPWFNKLKLLNFLL